MEKIFKNCEVIVYDYKDIANGAWAVVREQHKTTLQIYMGNLTIKKRLETAMPEETVGRKYGLPPKDYK